MQSHSILRLSVLLALIGQAGAEDIVFPPDAGIIDVTKPPYNATGTGNSDDTQAIQAALNDHPSQGAIIYLPNGTYLISSTLTWPHGNKPGSEEKNTILQGQSKSGTIIRLKDHCDGFSSINQPKSMVWTGKAPAQRFRNALRNLTLDVGKQNPGAIGLQFIANNQGCVRDVKIVSADAQGMIGLDMSYVDEIGPCLIKNVDIVGFDVGIKTGHVVNSMTFEHITLENQRSFGFQNEGQCVSIQDFKSNNAVTAIVNGPGSVLTLIIADLKGTGAAAERPAIINDKNAVILARDVNSIGYQKSIQNDAGNSEPSSHVAEYVSHRIHSLFPASEHTLNLPIKDAPEVAWDDLKNWACPQQFGGKVGKDCTDSIQAAVDSGKTTLYFPRGSYKIDKTIEIRKNIRRIIGCEAHIDVPNMPGVGFKLVGGSEPVVVVERISAGYTKTPFIDNASTRTLVLKDCCNVCGTFTGTGDVFIEDVCSNPFTNWRINQQNVWARQLNVENEGTHVINNGGTLWILGLKTERGGTLIETRNGGKTELLGGFCYSTSGPKVAPMFINTESTVSITIGEASFGGNPFKILVSETRGGVTKTLNKGDAPGRVNGSILPLYVGNSGEPLKITTSGQQ